MDTDMGDVTEKTRHHSLDAGHGATIAFIRLEATRPDLPAVMFCGGFRSDMTGTKAQRLESFCRRTGQACIRFDYTGHGASGGDFAEGTIGRWRDDALTVLDRATEGPVILVGSSMGAWIAVLLALARPERVAGLVTVAAAPDFTEDLIWARLTEAERAALARDGALLVPSRYDENPYPYTRALIEDGRRHLVLRGTVPVAVPARLFHGMADQDVPWEQSRRLAEALASTDVRLTLVKDGDHRLSRERDLVLMEEAVAELTAGATGAFPERQARG